MQQPAPSAPHQPTSIRPRVRARRGQATDPHSIAERVKLDTLDFRFSFVFPCDINIGGELLVVERCRLFRFE